MSCRESFMPCRDSKTGQIGSIVSSLIVVWLQKHYHWNAPLLLIGALFLVGAFAWPFINPHRKIFE